MTGLQTLPTELIEAVWIQLPDARSIVRLTQISRQFWGIFQQSSALQYKVQLELAGLRDVQSRATAGVSAARLGLLKAYQAAWKNFNCARSTQTTVNMSGDSWELVGNVLATYSSETGFVFTRIPSSIRRVPLAEWSISALPFCVNDFTMDLSQDLLVVVEVNSSSTITHLISLTTGGPHPLARNPRLSRDFRKRPGQFQIRIFGEYVGVMTESGEVSEVGLLVWEWKSSVLKKHLYEDDMTSFAFLDDRMLLISAWDTSGPVLRVLEIERPAEPDLFRSFSLGLPALSNDVETFEIDMLIQTEPPTSWTTESLLDEPFTTSHSDRLFVVSFRTWDTFRDSEPSFMLCVRLSTILSLMENPPAGTVNHLVLWDQWGPSSTRMLRLPVLPDPWVCFVYGQRCVIQTTPARCQILDFNPLSTGGKRILHEKTVDSRSRFFDEPVTTWAPFNLLSVEISPSAAVMLAEDGIVTVSPDEDSCAIFSL
ncbi:hypothetical protein K438DRAFT_1807028 [Mycena galopus ATCC 62051]|nr:hypothetical protein K438DRAFT_1807028 [Mycena galopus ATCC 62051]